jgi:16S rRNA processing protein RimM
VALLEVGRVVRSHGLRGDVVVELITNRAERMEPGSILDAEGGALVVRHSSRLPGPAADLHGRRFLVSFAGVTSREAADELRGLVLRAEPLADADALWVHDLIGSEVIDPVGTALGRVAAVQANPASDLLVLDGGALIPLRFVVGTEPGRVIVDPPAGLLDLP